MKLFTILGIMLIGASGLKAQDCNPSPPQGMQEIAAYSIFQGNYSNGDYPYPLKYGRWMYAKSQQKLKVSSGRFKLSSQYNKFIRMYTKLDCPKVIQAKEKLLRHAQIFFKIYWIISKM